MANVAINGDTPYQPGLTVDRILPPQCSIKEEADVKSALNNYNVAGNSESDTLALHDLLRRIEGEYREMPGLCVTAPQAQRLWGLDSTTCALVLTTLLERRILRRNARGAYVKC